VIRHIRIEHGDPAATGDVVVEGTYEGLSNSDKARWLRLARQLAQAMGEPIPTTFDSITEPVLAAVKDHL